MKKAFVLHVACEGMDWHDTSCLREMLKEGDSYEISNPLETIANHIRNILGQELVEGIKLENIPSTEQILKHLQDGTKFTVESAPKAYDGGAFSELEFTCDAKELKLSGEYAGGYSFEYTYQIQEIDEDNILYFAVETIKCPMKGVPSVERFYDGPFLCESEALAALDAMQLHEDASVYGSEKKLLVLDNDTIKTRSWYQDNMKVNICLKTHPELDVPENFEVFPEEHLRLLTEQIA